MTLEFINSKVNNIFFINAPSMKDKLDLGALLSRYSRSDKTAWQLYYSDEFQGNENRGAEFYEKVFAQYGDESITELVPSGFAVCLENIPILWSTRLLHYRQLSAIEKSSRYVLNSGFYEWDGAPQSYIITCMKMMNRFTNHYEHTKKKLIERYYSDEVMGPVDIRAVKAKALDYSRFYLPTATKTSLGIVANLRSWLNILAKELAFARRIEANLYMGKCLEPLLSLFKEYFPTIFSKFDEMCETNFCLSFMGHCKRDPVNTRFEIEDGNHLHKWMSGKPIILKWGRAKKHKAWRETELIDYTINIPQIDFGTFRDVQRHRHFTIIVNRWYGQYRKETDLLTKSLGTYLNITVKGNLRQWIHAIELRTQEQGHFKYRKLFQDCARLIANELGLTVKEVFPFADMRTDEEVGLGRLKSEKKIEQRNIN
jgi:thymidylate synthase ThyX